MTAVAACVLVIVLTRPPEPTGPAVAPQDTPAGVGPSVLAAAGDVASAANAGTRAVVGGSEAAVTLAPQSTVRRLSDRDGDAVLRLEHGTVHVDAVQATLRRLVVETDDVSLVAIGSAFQLENVDGLVQLEVTRGTVEVLYGAETLRIGAGNRWQRPRLADQTVVDDPASTTDDPAEPTRGSVAVPLATTPPVPRVNVSDADAAFLALLDARDSGAAPDVLITRADEYLAAQPEGPFAVEAEATRLEALARAGRYAEAFETGGQFCRNHPDSPRRTQIMWLRATVARDRLQNCELALPIYRELVLLLGESAAGAEASYFLAVCALEQGQRDEAVLALNRSLALAPDGPYGASAREMLDGIEGSEVSGVPGDG